MTVGTRRKKFIRNPERVEEVTLKALAKIQAGRGNPFRAGISEIIDAIDRRGGPAIPSRASVYRALDRMAEKGLFEITRRGERGNYTYNFIGVAAPEGSVTTTSEPQRVKRVYRRRVERTEMAAPEVTGDLQSLVMEERNLDAQLEAKRAELLSRIEQKRATLAALEVSLSGKEMVAA